MKTGVFGGTFDPPHLGHIIVAQDAALALGLDRVLFVPAASPPHKQGVAITPAHVRVRLLELALEGDDRFVIDTLELERAGPSFTVDTLEALVEREPRTEWTLLVGADQYAELHTWREPERIRQLAAVAVLTRGSAIDVGEDPIRARPAVTRLASGDLRVDVTRIDISATAIRLRVKAGVPIRYLVPAAVATFIEEQALYR